MFVAYTGSPAEGRKVTIPSHVPNPGLSLFRHIIVTIAKLLLLGNWATSLFLAISDSAVFEAMKKNTKGITEARRLWELSTKAAEAESKARAARVEVRVAKLKLKSARKQFKEAKKAAKVAVKDAEAIQRVLKAVAATVSKATAQTDIFCAAPKRNIPSRSEVTRAVRTASPRTGSHQETDVQLDEVPRATGAESISSVRKIPGFSSI